MLNRSLLSVVLPALALLAPLTGCGSADPTEGTGSATSTTTEAVDGVFLTISTKFACTTALGDATFNVKISGHTPATIALGKYVQMTNFQATVTIPASLVNEAVADGATTASGEATTINVRSTDAVHPVVNAARTPVSFGPVPLVKGKPVVAEFPVTPEKIGAWMPAAAGTMTFTPGEVIMNVTLSPLGTSTITCLPTAPPTLSTTTAE